MAKRDAGISITRSSLRKLKKDNELASPTPADAETSQTLEKASRRKSGRIKTTTKEISDNPKTELSDTKAKSTDVDNMAGNRNQAYVLVTKLPPENERKKSQTKRAITKPISTEKKESGKDTTSIKPTKCATQKKPTVLSDWVIKPVPDCRGICVEGQVTGREDFWHSTAIVKAVEPKLVVTSTGSMYQLKGKINRLLTVHYGIAKDVAKSFADGFPDNWKELIRDYYQDMESSITVTEECMSPKKFLLLKAKQRCVQKKTPQQLPVDVHSILTPTGLLKREINHSEVTKTRSGRMSLPPLAGWAGQHYVKSPKSESVLVSFATDTAKEALNQETRHVLSLSKRDKMMVCQNSLSKSLMVSPATASAVLQAKKNISPSSSCQGPGKHFSSLIGSACEHLKNSPQTVTKELPEKTSSSSTACAKNSKGRPRKRTREEMDQSREDPNTSHRSSNCKAKRKAKRQKPDAKLALDDNGWTQLEKDKLHRVLRDVNGDESDYWSLVSQTVGTKSEQECQQFYRDFLEKKTSVTNKTTVNKGKKSKKETDRQKGGPIRGKKGTLKRKRDLRDFLDEQNEGYEDDLFLGSPFVGLRHKSRLPDMEIDFSKNDSDVFGANHNFFTPVAGRNPFDTPGLRFKATLASVKKTPADQEARPALDITPLSADSRKHDVYIKNFMEKKKKLSSNKAELPPPQEDLEASDLPIKSLFPAATPNILVENLPHEDSLDKEHDDEEEDDGGNQFLYYWSDND